METSSVNSCSPLPCCEGAVIPGNQSILRLEQHGKTQQGAEIQRYMGGRRGERELERDAFIILGVTSVQIPYVSAL